MRLYGLAPVSFADEKGFNGKISRCIDRALDSLGAGVRQSLYFQIERKFHVQKGELEHKPSEVIEHLQEILGPTGSSFVEKLLIREIRKEFDLEFEQEQSLDSVIAHARRKFLDVSK